MADMKGLKEEIKRGKEEMENLEDCFRVKEKEFEKKLKDRLLEIEDLKEEKEKVLVQNKEALLSLRE